MKSGSIFFVMMGLCLCLSSCAQSTKHSEMTQKISQVYKDVQYRDQSINYHADFYNSDCSFELTKRHNTQKTVKSIHR